MAQLTIGGGLNNLGNTCFFNAALQSVLHTQSLANCFSTHRHSQQCASKRNNQWCVFCEMENIYAHTRDVRSFAPNSMINHLKSIFKKFKLGRQEDSHQFLRYLIEGMQEAETGKLGKDREINQQKIKKTNIFKIFGGIMKTCVECLSCGHKSITSERYYDFNIECQRSNSLLEGIASHFTAQKLEGANKYLCEKCKIRSNAGKRFLLDSVPKVVTFQLKRFTNSLRKIGKFIQYPLTIDLGKHLQEPHKLIMKLYAVVVHAGGSSYSGHYYAFVRVGDSWYKMDDSYVSKCSAQSALGQNAYILFYEKVYEDKVQENKQQLPQQNNQQNHVVPQVKLKIKENQNKSIIQEPTQSIINQKPLEPKKNSINGISALTNNQLNHNQKEKRKPQETEKGKQQEKKENAQIDDQEPLVAPTALIRRKSKEQMEQSLSTQQLIWRAVEQIMDISTKNSLKRPRNRAVRHMYDLRKYQTQMIKKRKLG